jgi:hypothetical protein
MRTESTRVTVEEDLRQIADRLRRRYRGKVVGVLETGQDFARARELHAEPGKWLDWLKKNSPDPDRTVRRYIRTYEWCKVRAILATVANLKLSVSALYALVEGDYDDEVTKIVFKRAKAEWVRRDDVLALAQYVKEKPQPQPKPKPESKDPNSKSTSNSTPRDPYPLAPFNVFNDRDGSWQAEKRALIIIRSARRIGPQPGFGPRWFERPGGRSRDRKNLPCR